MLEITLEDIQKKFDSLPENLRLAIIVSNADEKIHKIGREHGLNINQISELLFKTQTVMLGFIHPDQFEGSLKEISNISPLAIKGIYRDINEQILKNIKNDLIEFFEKSKEIETPKTSIEPMFTEEIINIDKEQVSFEDKKNNDIMESAGIEIIPLKNENKKEISTNNTDVTPIEKRVEPSNGLYDMTFGNEDVGTVENEEIKKIAFGNLIREENIPAIVPTKKVEEIKQEKIETPIAEKLIKIEKIPEIKKEEQIILPENISNQKLPHISVHTENKTEQSQAQQPANNEREAEIGTDKEIEKEVEKGIEKLAAPVLSKVNEKISELHEEERIEVIIPPEIKEEKKQFTVQEKIDKGIEQNIAPALSKVNEKISELHEEERVLQKLKEEKKQIKAQREINEKQNQTIIQEKIEAGIEKIIAPTISKINEKISELHEEERVLQKLNEEESQQFKVHPEIKEEQNQANIQEKIDKGIEQNIAPALSKINEKISELYEEEETIKKLKETKLPETSVQPEIQKEQPQAPVQQKTEKVLKTPIETPKAEEKISISPISIKEEATEPVAPKEQENPKEEIKKIPKPTEIPKDQSEILKIQDEILKTIEKEEKETKLKTEVEGIADSFIKKEEVVHTSAQPISYKIKSNSKNIEENKEKIIPEELTETKESIVKKITEIQNDMKIIKDRTIEIIKERAKLEKGLSGVEKESPSLIEVNDKISKLYEEEKTIQKLRELELPQEYIRLLEKLDKITINDTLGKKSQEVKK